ncbi:MAG: hypothetical protein HY958_07940, partial [Bacteroidia bacterium]|nr:hypothetical protein [Bacteroidia bacterium]
SSPTSFGNDLVLETTNNKSNIIFSANFIPRMVVTDGASGFVGVGNNFLDPVSQVHIHDGSLPTYLRITNASTGATALDGLTIGNVGTLAEITQWETNNILFRISNADQMLQNRFFLSWPGAAGINTTTPLSVLHVDGVNFGPVIPAVGTGEVFRTVGGGQDLNIWRMFAGTTEIGDFYNTTAGAGGLYSVNDLHIRAQSGMMLLKSQGDFERVKITNVSATNNMTRVAISSNPAVPCTTLVSLLTLGDNAPTNGGGSRPWMQTGTYTTTGTDNMYFGLKNEPPSSGLADPDRQDAIINWGDNVNNGGTDPPQGPDYLRFIFTSPLIANTTGSTGPDGLEVMRMTPTGLVGIGDSYNGTNGPMRRLDIHHDGMVSGSYVGVPQLRLSQTITGSQWTRIYTDFETTNQGNLLINPFWHNQARHVGINLTPTDIINQELDVNGNGRFRNMPPTTDNLNVVLIHPNDGTSLSGVLYQRNYPLGIGADADFYDIGSANPPQFNNTPAYREGITGMGFLITDPNPAAQLEVHSKIPPQLRLSETILQSVINCVFI